MRVKQTARTLNRLFYKSREAKVGVLYHRELEVGGFLFVRRPVRARCSTRSKMGENRSEWKDFFSSQNYAAPLDVE